MITAKAKLPFCVALLLAFLSGCARIEMARLAEKCDFSADPWFVSLHGKIPLSPAEALAPPSLAEITNDNKPTSEERNSLLELDTASQFCRVVL
jgi:hypothetical protein